jgi:hypothetical protein
VGRVGWHWAFRNARTHGQAAAGRAKQDTSGHCLESLEAQCQPVPNRAVLGASREVDGSTVQPLPADGLSAQGGPASTRCGIIRRERAAELAGARVPDRRAMAMSHKNGASLGNMPGSMRPSSPCHTLPACGVKSTPIGRMARGSAGMPARFQLASGDEVVKAFGSPPFIFVVGWPQPGVLVPGWGLL